MGAIKLPCRNIENTYWFKTTGLDLKNAYLCNTIASEQVYIYYCIYDYIMKGKMG